MTALRGEKGRKRGASGSGSPALLGGSQLNRTDLVSA
jgi:hypothetical protein